MRILLAKKNTVSDLPVAGGAPAAQDTLDPTSLYGRLHEKNTSSEELLSKVPSLKKDLSSGETFLQPVHDNVPTMGINTAISQEMNPQMRKALKIAARALEAESRFEKLQEAASQKDVPEEDLLRPIRTVLARAGYCSGSSRELFEKGVVRVNNIVVREPQMRVSPKDDITVGTHRCLIDFPRIYRLSKRQEGFVIINGASSSTNDHRIKGLPTFAYNAGGVLSPTNSGLELYTNDKGLAEYITNSHDIERDWNVEVSGAVHTGALNNFNKAFEFEGKQFSNVEVVIKSFVYTGKTHKRIRDQNIMSTKLSFRTWGPGPNVRRLFQSIGKKCKSIERVKIGPYNAENLPPHNAMEAFIDDGLMRYTSPEWRPWVEFHEPLLSRGVASKLQRYVNFKRDGAEGVESLADDLDVCNKAVHNAGFFQRMKAKQKT